MKLPSWISLVAAACAGVAAWCSVGAPAVIAGGAGLERVGLLPAVWLLVGFVAAGVGAAWIVRLGPRRALALFFSLVLLLPWIPAPVPAAFLMWSGRLGLAVWIFVCV